VGVNLNEKHPANYFAVADVLKKRTAKKARFLIDQVFVALHARK
jgi:hypothetical protein